jgi:hypothetical protein
MASIGDTGPRARNRDGVRASIINPAIANAAARGTGPFAPLARLCRRVGRKIYGNGPSLRRLQCLISGHKKPYGHIEGRDCVLWGLE